MQIYQYRLNIDTQLTSLDNLIKTIQTTNNNVLKIVLLGNGQLAKALLRNFTFKQNAVVYHLTRDDVDFYQIERLTELILKLMTLKNHKKNC
jgi:NADH/NAD ratio-sensing transcriptional regulator Rex